jgi:hypothetical protein
MGLPRSLAALLALVLLDAAAKAAGGAFLAEMEDLPLAPGLTENSGGLLFDSPSGRIVDAAASGDITPEQLRSFYAQTLPQLGWEAVGDLAFRRDKEVLQIVLDADKQPLTAHFHLAPR